jgi:hypothetical protein
MNGRRDGRPLRPHTSYDPLLKQIFDEQERLAVSSRLLSDISGVPKRIIDQLRHPKLGYGKNVPLYQVRRLAEALDFEFPDRMRKR